MEEDWQGQHEPNHLPEPSYPANGDTSAENLALQLAHEIDDHAAGQKIATLWQERNHTYIHRLWKWDLKNVQDAMAWALADEPEEEKTAPDTKPDSEEGEAAEAKASPKAARTE